ncbi:MAG: CBS domain-containing protein [DPANN group archaeon]|nr:CBS domain-containing protein [DPANN group archaeon]
MIDDISSFNAIDIMSRTIVTIDESSTVNDAITQLRNNNIKNLIVLSKKKYKGIFSYRQLFSIYGKDIQKISIKPYIQRPPIIPPDTTLPQIADKMHKLNLKIIPIGDDDALRGVITQSDIVKEAINSKIFKEIRAQDIMSPKPITMQDDETLAKALQIMREHNISHIPILNKDGIIKGLVESKDIIGHILTLKESYGGLMEISPSGKGSTVDSHSYISQKISDKTINISSFMKTEMVIGHPDDKISDIYTSKGERPIPTVLIKENDRLIGIITPKDIVRHTSDLVEKKTMLIWISGARNIVLDNFYLREMYRMIEETASKLSKKTDINAFSVHVKTYNIEGKRIKYSLRCRLSTAKHIFVASHDSWDMRDAFGQLMDKIERLVIQSQEKIIHNMQENRRQTIYFEGVD